MIKQRSMYICHNTTTPCSAIEKIMDALQYAFSINAGTVVSPTRPSPLTKQKLILALKTATKSDVFGRD